MKKKITKESPNGSSHYIIEPTFPVWVLEKEKVALRTISSERDLPNTQFSISSANYVATNRK